MTANAASSRPVPRRLPADATAIAVALLGFAAAFCVLLWPEWRHNPDLSHGFFAPVVFCLLLHESRRHGPQRWVPAGAPALAGLTVAMGLGFGLFGLAGIFAASLAWSHALVCMILAASLGCFLLGGLLILADDRLRILPINWVSLTAVFLWILASPLPDGTYARLTLGLQAWVTGSVLHTLHLLGIPARQHGNIIELATTTVGVEEACSGIRSLVSCVYAGFFFAAWQVRRIGARLVLIVAAPLLALGMNFLRSLTLTLLANSGKDIGGFWHDATGFAILGVTALLLAGLAILLESKPEAVVAAETPATPVPPKWPLRIFWTAIAATLVLAGFYYANSRKPETAGIPLPDLAGIVPARARGWSVRSPDDLYQFADVLQTSHLLERTYLRPREGGQFTQLTVYIAYWAPAQASVSRVASHTPDACWPGSGWTAQRSPPARDVPVLPGMAIATGEHRIFQSGDGYVQNVWFWHVYDGRVIDYRDPYSLPALFQLALQYGFRRQGDQYFVRISSNRPWAELAGEPLVREIFTNLDRIGI